jgi:putative GTP pyrophosphokinase
MIEKDWYIKNKDKFEKLSDKVRTILVDILDENKIEYHQVDSRTKTFESFSKKAENPKYKSASEITDIAGIRVITYVEDSIPSICKFIEDNFNIDKENSLDKSKDLGLDKVGYKSVHYVADLPDSRTQLTENKKFKGLKFEIQVRTILQHSWAEIEHDRNYKFGGKLPSEIQRRFKLLAGLLELADNEFNSISKEIDNYSKEVKDKTQKGDLNISINSTSLQQYLKLKLSKFKNIVINPAIFIDQKIVDEVKKYGISTLAEFEDIIPKKLFNFYNKNHYKVTFVGIVRDILIINDYQKYFSESYDGEWWFNPEDIEDLAVFKEFGLSLPMFEKAIGWE